MKKPRKTSDEAYRLDTLQALRLLDTPPEERFDRITRIAARTLGTSWAMLNLVDEHRLCVKSSLGLDLREIPRDLSFCGHTILDDDILVIPDTSKDRRFKDNPYVTGDPGIRFYAGCPLSAANGTMVASLCVCDSEPRDFSEEDMVLLRDLANIAEQELDAARPASLDALTGLSDSKSFFHLSRHMLNLCERLDRPATLVYLRLGGKHFRNTLHGHSRWDRLLMSFADILLSVSRESDIRGRVDQDEFGMLLANCEKSRVDVVLDRLRTALSEYRHGTDSEQRLEFHATALEFDPERYEDVKLLLDEAARLLHQQLHPKKTRKRHIKPVY